MEIVELPEDSQEQSSSLMSSENEVNIGNLQSQLQKQQQEETGNFLPRIMTYGVGKGLPNDLNDNKSKELLIQNRRILIVDDEPYNLMGLEVLLQQTGYKNIMNLIDKAGDGLEAVQCVRNSVRDMKFSYGLIIIDCSMPLMNGYEATEKIRRYLKVKGIMQPMVVACTGHTEDLYIKKAWRY